MDTEELKNRTKEFAHRCVKLALAFRELRMSKERDKFDLEERLIEFAARAATRNRSCKRKHQTARSAGFFLLHR